MTYYPPPDDKLRKALFVVQAHNLAWKIERDEERRHTLARQYIDSVGPMCAALGPECLANMARVVLAALYAFEDGNALTLDPAVVCGLEHAIADFKMIEEERERIAEE